MVAQKTTSTFPWVGTASDIDASWIRMEIRLKTLEGKYRDASSLPKD
jgi:hypothetical protein